jgi:hypothetical protein
MNKITLIGNLTHDPEVRSTPNGVTSVCFHHRRQPPVRRFKRRAPDDFFRINAWRQLGETCARYLSKGAGGGPRRAAGAHLRSQGRTRACRWTFRRTRSSSLAQAAGGKLRTRAARHGERADMAGFTDISPTTSLLTQNAERSAAFNFD